MWHDLKSQVEVYLARYGVYPEVVPGDPVYGTRDKERALFGPVRYTVPISTIPVPFLRNP